MSMQQVSLVLDLFSFTSRQMLLILSCWNTYDPTPSFFMIKSSGIVFTCRSMKSFIHITKFIILSISIITANVELVELIFYFVDMENTAPFSSVIITLVWLLIMFCTVNKELRLYNRSLSQMEFLNTPGHFNFF